MNDMTNNVSASIGQLMNAGSNILTTVRKMNVQANEVNQMIGIQMEAVTQVSKSSNTVKITSQSVGEEGEKLSAIAENLVTNSEQLKTYVNQFKIGADEIIAAPKKKKKLKAAPQNNAEQTSKTETPVKPVKAEKVKPVIKPENIDDDDVEDEDEEDDIEEVKLSPRERLKLKAKLMQKKS